MHTREVPLIRTWNTHINQQDQKLETLTLSLYFMLDGTKEKLLTFELTLRDPSLNPSFGSAYIVAFPIC
jgi:hypothetical protein